MTQMGVAIGISAVAMLKRYRIIARMITESDFVLNSFFFY
jgi:hypothetical protein